MSSDNSNSVTTINANTNSSDTITNIKKKTKLIGLSKKAKLPIITANHPILKEIYKNKQEHGPLYFFSSEQKKVPKPKVNKNKRYVNSYIKMYELEQRENNETQEYNVFNAQDKIIKELMSKFYEKRDLTKVNKLNRKKNALNKLYDITPEYKERLLDAKKIKTLDLEDYQKNILTTIPSQTIGEGGIMDLVQNLKNLKYECDSVKPLPPINVKIIEDHIYKKSNSKSVKKMNLKEFLQHTNEPKDEYEKEQRIIKNLKSYKVLPKFKRNKNYDFLPSFLRESLNKNLRFHL